MAKVSLLITFIISMLFYANVEAQKLTFNGVIKDAETQQPIPFVHCKITGTNQGFVTDRNGEFSYTTERVNLEITISSIGYKSMSITLKAGQPNQITLQPDTQTLSEVVITSVDYERELLQKVLDNISQNYPQNTERLEGTMIEQLAKDSLYEVLIYTAKATVEADKLTYGNRNKFSNVKIIGGETEYHQSMDSSFTKIMAGVHNIHRFDIVAARMQPFDNIKTKSYAFELVDTLSYEGRALFKMKFEASLYKGFLYIQDSTYALVKGEYIVKEKKLNSLGMGSNRLFLNFHTEYFKEDSLFRVSYINYQTGFSKTEGEEVEKVYLNNFFYLNSSKKTETLIGYNEQTNYTDVLIDELSTKEIGQNSTIDEKTKRSIQRERSILQALKNITSTQGLNFLIYQSSLNRLEVPELGIQTNVRSQTRQYIYFYSIGYTFSNSLALEYQRGTSFNRKETSLHTVHVKWNSPFTKNRRWTLGISGGINYLKTDLKKDDLNSISGTLDGITFEQGKVNINEISEQFNLISEVQLRYRIGSRFYLTANSTLPFNWRNEVDVNIQQGDINTKIDATVQYRRFHVGFYQFGLGLQVTL